MHDDTHTDDVHADGVDTDSQTRDDATRTERHRRPTGRRTFLAGTAALGAGGLAGCTDLFGGDDGDEPFDYVGSGPGARADPGGTPMSELPELEGELTVYSGRGQFLVDTLIEDINGRYDDFQATPRYGGSSEMANQILTEGSGTNADVFFSATGGALATLAGQDRTQALSDDTLDMVPEEFRTDSWIGTGGRVRSIPYNTDAASESDLPDDISSYPDLDADFGWAPGYEACQEFVTAMRVLEGDDAAREWLEGVVDAGITSYADEQLVCQAIADGEIDVGFTNHYYVQRVLASRNDPPLATAFTSGDAGATFNVAGAAVVDEASDATLAENFVRHLLSAEAQVFFATRTYEYPLVPDVEPEGDLPPIDELDVPSIDLAELSNIGETVEMMRDVGIEV